MIAGARDTSMLLRGSNHGFSHSSINSASRSRTVFFVFFLPPADGPFRTAVPFWGQVTCH